MPPDDVLGAPLEELDFLTRSPNRIRVLDALTEGPTDRSALEAETGVARATLGRILEDFEARGWVLETGTRTYETTQLGAYVAREVTTTLERFAPVPDLNEVAEWFPPGGFEFDLSHLAGATVVRSRRHDAVAPTAHIARRVREAESRVRILTYSVLPDVMDACWRGTVEGDVALESVLDADAVDGVASDPALLEQAFELFETDEASVYLYRGDVPTTVFVVDESVLLCLSGGEGAPLAVIETDDETVLEWAESVIDDHRNEGERLDDALSDE